MMSSSRPIHISGPEDTAVKVVIYENSTTATRTKNLEKMLKHFNYNYEIIGRGEKWEGWHGRLKTCIKYFNKMDDDAYVLMSDGRDVLVGEDASSFSEKAIRFYKRVGGKIIFNGETLCCVAGKEFYGTPQQKEEYFESIRKFFEARQPKPATPLYTLNYGLAFGKVRDFKEMFNVLELKPDEDDQGVLIQKIMAGKFNNYEIDYESELFGVMFDQPPEWDATKKKYLSPAPKSYPVFLHFPGKGNDYNECAKVLMTTHLHEFPYL
jgi:hypothetical protein